jgi:polyhydroxybutyrate depolymerase
MTRRGLFVFLLGILWTGLAAFGAELERLTWTVDGVEREALVHVPAHGGSTGTPLVFAFHGHGGSDRQASRSFRLHEVWPDALVVYPQGLPTAGQLTDQAGKEAGWQGCAGSQGDWDLKFFDVMLADLQKRYHVDAKRIYATGHSNGGGFTYLLWAERGSAFAAFAPSSAVLARGNSKFTPKPVLHLGSPNDPLVKWAWQEKMIDRDLEVDGAGPRRASTGYIEYPSTKGADVATYLHTGGHRYPAAAPELIVKFFQVHAQP